MSLIAGGSMPLTVSPFMNLTGLTVAPFPDLFLRSPFGLHGDIGSAFSDMNFGTSMGIPQEAWTTRHREIADDWQSGRPIGKFDVDGLVVTPSSAAGKTIQDTEPGTVEESQAHTDHPFGLLSMFFNPSFAASLTPMGRMRLLFGGLRGIIPEKVHSEWETDNGKGMNDTQVWNTGEVKLPQGGFFRSQGFKSSSMTVNGQKFPMGSEAPSFAVPESLADERVYVAGPGQILGELEEGQDLETLTKPSTEDQVSLVDVSTSGQPEITPTVPAESSFDEKRRNQEDGEATVARSAASA